MARGARFEAISCASQAACDGLSSGRTLSFGELPQLEPGEVAQWRILVRAKEASNVVFKVELTSDANKQPVIEMEPTHLY